MRERQVGLSRKNYRGKVCITQCITRTSRLPHFLPLRYIQLGRRTKEQRACSMDEPASPPGPTILSIDGEVFPLEKARLIAKRSGWEDTPVVISSWCGRVAKELSCCLLLAAVFYFGFAFLPFLWFINVWLFWPEFKHGDAQIKKRECHLPECLGWAYSLHIHSLLLPIHSLLLSCRHPLERTVLCHLLTVLPPLAADVCHRR